MISIRGCGLPDRCDFIDPDLVFDEAAHIYTWRGRPLVSVTTWLGRFHEPFDSQYHARRIAERDGSTTQLVLDLWASKAKAAADLGTEVHAFAERMAGGRLGEGGLSLEAAGYARGVCGWFASHPDALDPAGWAIPEVRMCWPEAGLAGTADLLCRLDGEPAIVDWKTSESIEYTGFRQMHPPVDDLPDCNFFHYTIQLNAYRRILRERYNYCADRLAVVWLGPDGTFRHVKIPLIESHIGRMLEARP